MHGVFGGLKAARYSRNKIMKGSIALAGTRKLKNVRTWKSEHYAKGFRFISLNDESP